MGIKSLLVRPYSFLIRQKVLRDKRHAVRDQNRIFKELINKGAKTKFGTDHNFDQISSHSDYTKKVPIRTYEQLKKYFDLMAEGKPDILWPGVPRYFAKTSGTTSGAKYIPLTTESIPNHFGTARNAAFNYAAGDGDHSFIDGKLIFLSGSPVLQEKNGIKTGRLSGISNHLIPSWLKTSQMPSYETNCLEDWETKLDKIVEETHDKDMRMISGIPPWVQMYYERLLSYTGKSTVREIFPNLSLFVYGGVNFEPYRNKLEALVGERIDSIETYPASEGFIAFQDRQDDNGLLLNTNSGIFYEFVKADEFYDENPTRLMLDEVETETNYVIILNSNAGLWAYNIGDTVQFTSLDPYRIRVSGRIKHFISAFGEHVIGKEVEEALANTLLEHPAEIIEFTVAPQVNPDNEELPYHEWLIEFGKEPASLNDFSNTLDRNMCSQNSYYDDLIEGKILRPLKVNSLPENSFRKYMKSIGKLGGQNKVPRLSNDRKIAEEILR